MHVLYFMQHEVINVREQLSLEVSMYVNLGERKEQRGYLKAYYVTLAVLKLPVRHSRTMHRAACRQRLRKGEEGHLVEALWELGLQRGRKDQFL